MVGSSVKRQHLGRSLDGRKDLLVGIGNRQHLGRSLDGKKDLLVGLGKRQHWKGGG